MKISIITVVYNRVLTLDRAIQSVLKQTFKHIEYIVIDGCSTDGTMDVVNKYKEQIALVVSEKDNGMYDALNKGIKLATGDVVGILHADDEFADETIIEQIMQQFEINKSIDCVYGDVGFVKEAAQNKIIRYYSSAQFKPSLFQYGFMPAHPTFFCYKKYFEQFGLYRTDMDIAADFDLLVRFLKIKKLNSMYLPKMLVKMNLGGKSTNGISSTIKINTELKQILKEHSLPSGYLRLYARYFLKVREYWKTKSKVK